MAYANFYASGRKIERYFKGGLDTDCFKEFERNGFKIEKKKGVMSLKEEFKQWLNTNVKKSSGAKSSYVRAIDLLEIPLEYNVFLIQDIDKLNLLYQDLLKKQTDINSKYYNADAPSYGKDRYYSAGIAKYIEFIKENNKKFTWVQTHIAIANYLKDKKSEQSKLIEILKNAGVRGFSDRNVNNEDIDLEVIDPFTFFCYIYKYGDSRRLQVLQNISEQLNIHYPKDECGIPSSNAQKVWLFPYKELRVNNEIERLWSFFFQVLKDEINNDSFEDLLQIRGIARTKLTEALFNVNPYKYFPINGPTKPYLESVFGINPKFKNFDEYKNILSQLQSKTNKPFYQISYEAWLWNEEQKKSKTSIENTIAKMKEEFIEYLENTNLAASTIGVYSNNFEEYLEGYLNKNNISILNQENFKELSKINWSQYRKGTSFEHEGKGHKWFVSFFEEKLEDANESVLNSTPLNQILYGPPGTGKTYKTKELAVNIILGKEERSRTEILNSYDELLSKEQVSFTTFHQSMSYEDFVEGIKPKMEDDDETLKYQIEKGIFKKIADKSKGISGSKQKVNSIDFSKSNYFKMSIGGKHRIDVHNWCVANNLVALGWGDNEDYSEYNNINNWNAFRDKFKKEFPYLVENSKYNIQAMFTFQKMKIGDIVLVSLGNHILDAVGVIEGSYEYDSENEFGFHHYRKVKWLGTNMSASPEIFIDKGISQQSIYEFNKQDIKIESFKEYFSEAEEIKKTPNYVLIIDEINRGNISSIFGELITLLEEDKRSGQAEEIEVILPYSKEPFKVPSNLYIIGTMNTADRSVEALDTALRRRFSFTEIAPDSTLLEDKKVEEIELKTLLQTINDRIEILMDKDHKIGHSYFLNIETLEDLKQTFKNKVIPLLEEYFFGDYGKIGLVLGSAFIELEEDENKVSFAKNFTEKYEDAENLREKAVYTFTDADSWEASSFISIYEV